MSNTSNVNFYNNFSFVATSPLVKNLDRIHLTLNLYFRWYYRVVGCGMAFEDATCQGPEDGRRRAHPAEARIVETIRVWAALSRAPGVGVEVRQMDSLKGRCGSRPRRVVPTATVHTGPPSQAGGPRDPRGRTGETGEGIWGRGWNHSFRVIQCHVT